MYNLISSIFLISCKPETDPLLSELDSVDYKIHPETGEKENPRKALCPRP